MVSIECLSSAGRVRFDSTYVSAAASYSRRGVIFSFGFVFGLFASFSASESFGVAALHSFSLARYVSLLFFGKSPFAKASPPNSNAPLIEVEVGHFSKGPFCIRCFCVGTASIPIRLVLTAPLSAHMVSESYDCPSNVSCEGTVGLSGE